MQIKVERPGATMTVVTVGDVTLYFSYETCIALEHTDAGGWGSPTKLRRDQTYSRTTAKHMTQFGVKDWPQVDDETFERAAAI